MSHAMNQWTNRPPALLRPCSLAAAVVILGLLLPAGASPAVLSSADPAADPVVDPAWVFPAGTLIFSDIRAPADGPDRLSRTRFWVEASVFLDALEDAASTGDDASGSGTMCPVIAGRGLPGRLAAAMREWDAASPLRRQLVELAGERFSAGLIADDYAKQPVLVCAARGAGGFRSGEAHAEALRRLTGWTLGRDDLRLAVGGSAGRFDIVDPGGDRLLIARQVGGWLVFSAPGGAAAMNGVADALAGGTVHHGGSLAANDAYRRAAAGLPERPWARAYIHSSVLADRLAAGECGLTGPLARMGAYLLSRLSGVGIAREFSPEGVRTWISGAIHIGDASDPLVRLIRSASPVFDPLSARLPASLLGAYDIGVPPDRLLALAAKLLETAAPGLHEAMTGLIDTFGDASGLDPETDLFPFLGDRLAVGWLPPEPEAGGWPFPRPVMLVPVTDQRPVAAFLAEWIRWEAGAIAPHTGGMVGAAVKNETHEAVEMAGLQMDCVLDVPLPSPSYALADDLLIVSPVRSAVRETISAIRGTAPAYTRGGRDVPTAVAGASQPVERIQLDLGALGRALSERTVPYVPSVAGRSDAPGSDDPDGESGPLAIPAFLRMLAAMGRADGSVSVDGDGGFTVCVDWRPE